MFCYFVPIQFVPTSKIDRKIYITDTQCVTSSPTQINGYCPLANMMFQLEKAGKFRVSDKDQDDLRNTHVQQSYQGNKSSSFIYSSERIIVAAIINTFN